MHCNAPTPARGLKVSRLVTALCVVLAGAAPVAAQDVCRPPASSNEAKLLAFYEAPILFSTVGAPERLAPGVVRIGGEVVPMPTPDESIQRSEYCGNKNEQTRLTPVFGRPRVAVGLPFGFAFEAGYVPPVTVGKAEPHIGSAALSRVLALPSVGGMTLPAFLALRAHATLGRVRGPIVCAASELQQTNPTAYCYGSSPSRDTFRPNMWGGEATLGAWSPGRRVGAFVGGGYTWLRPRFQVGFTDLNGVQDSSRVEADLRRASVFGGATLRATSRLDISTQVHTVPGEVTTFRLAADWRLR